jgi:hypothetical protein
MDSPLVIAYFRDPISMLSLRLILSVGIMSTVRLDAERQKLASMLALPGFSMEEEISLLFCFFSECSKDPKLIKTDINAAKISKKSHENFKNFSPKVTKTAILNKFKEV